MSRGKSTHRAQRGVDRGEGAVGARGAEHGRARGAVVGSGAGHAAHYAKLVVKRVPNYQRRIAAAHGDADGACELGSNPKPIGSAAHIRARKGGNEARGRDPAHSRALRPVAGVTRELGKVNVAAAVPVCSDSPGHVERGSGTLPICGSRSAASGKRRHLPRCEADNADAVAGEIRHKEVGVVPGDAAGGVEPR